MYAALLAERVGSNLARAQSANHAGDNGDELRSLLFTVQDVATLLVMWNRGKIPDKTAEKYAEMQSSVSLRIKELVVAQFDERNKTHQSNS
jgi:hypothetical protein